MRAGLSWHDSAQVEMTDARLILQIASGKPVGDAAKTQQFVSLRQGKKLQKTKTPKRPKP